MGQNPMAMYNQRKMMRKKNPQIQGMMQNTAATPMQQSPQTMSMLQNRPMLRRPTAQQNQMGATGTPGQMQQGVIKPRDPGQNIPTTPFTQGGLTPMDSSQRSGDLTGSGGNTWTPQVKFNDKGQVVVGANGQRFETPKAAFNTNIYGIGAGNALQEGLNFTFQDLPTVNQANFTGLEGNAGFQGDTGRSLFGQGSGTFNTGLNSLTDAGGAYGSITNMGLNEAQNQLNIQKDALAQQLGLQNLALDPTLGANAADLLSGQAEARQQAINARYDIGGSGADQYAKEQANAIADLQNSGVLDSTTGVGSIASLAGKLIRDRSDALSAAQEQSFQDVNTERGRVGEAATNFGSLNNALARTQGATASGFLSNAAQGAAGMNDVGKTQGTLGLGQQQLGQGMLSDANSALASALGLQMENRGQEGDLQLAELGQRLAASQGTLNNLNAQKDRRFQQDIMSRQMALQEALANPSFWGGLGADLLGRFGFSNAGSTLM